MIKFYTVGVGISPSFDPKDKVIYLIKKTKPIRQSGQLNLPGGKYEDNEIGSECISREWHEELGVKIPPEDWKYVGYMQRPNDFIVGIYYNESFEHVGASTMTEEQVWPVKLSDFLNGIYRNIDTGEMTEGIMPNVDLIVRHCLGPDFKKYGALLNIKYPEKPEGEKNYGDASS